MNEHQDGVQKLRRTAGSGDAVFPHLRLFFFSLSPFVVAGLLLTGFAGISRRCAGQEQPARKIKTKVDPLYPELARRLNLQGVVRVQVTVSADGSVKEVKEMGGNPVLLDALVHAVKKWKFEAADKDSTVEVKFEFAGPN